MKTQGEKSRRQAVRRRAAALSMLAALMLAVPLLSACHRSASAPAPAAMVVALPIHASSGDVVQGIRYPVEAGSRYSTTMAFRVAGKVIERSVRLGDTVRKGQELARLDPQDAEKQAASAQAALDAAVHRLTFTKQQIDRDQAQFAQNLIAANQLEQSQDAYAAALAGEQQAAAQLVVARNALQYTTLLADHDGSITSENADTGQVVVAGQAVYGLAWTGDTDAVLDAAAADLQRIAVGEAASVRFTALPGRAFAARVREIAPAADPQSRTYRVKLTLAEPAGVRLGMTGDAVLAPVPAASGNSVAPAYIVPATAIFHEGRKPAVWIIRPLDSTLELRPVTVDSYRERGAIVSEGLTDGEVVVLAGVHTVHAGQQVQPVKPLFEGEAEDAAP
jgi:membrane fusion protein, multidrug efflux system